MATQPKKLDDQHVQACLVIIRDMYSKYDPYEIQQAYIINRSEITAREQHAAAVAELKILQDRLDNSNQE